MDISALAFLQNSIKECPEKEDTFPYILRAMEEYASSVSVEFAEYISGNGWQQYDGYDRWICPQDSNSVLSTKDLYKKYLQSIE